MRNLTAELLVLAGTVLPTTDGGALDMQEQAICKQPKKRQNLNKISKSSQNFTSPRKVKKEHRNNCRKKRFGATCYTGTAA